MYLSRILAITLLLLTHPGLCINFPQQRMDPWPKDADPQNKGIVWSKTITIPGRDLNHDELLSIARSQYNWVVEQPSSKDKSAILVASMWDPLGEKVWSSTLPSGTHALEMELQSTLKNPAPQWWSIVKDLKTPNGGKSRYYHAEDNVFFNWESSTDRHVEHGKYPPGTMMVVWGRFSAKEAPKERQPCGEVGFVQRNPSCQQVADQLGVRYWTTVPRQPAVAQIGSNAGACGSGEGSSRNPRIRGEGHARRAASSCAFPTLGPFPSPVKADKLSFQLPPKDFSSQRATITPPPSKTKAGPTPSCSLQNQDPDQGINSQYCVCESSITLPLLSKPATVIETESCHYTALPSSKAIHSTPHLGPATTNTKLCQVCTPVVVNEDECTSIKNCVVQTAEATVLAGSSAVHVGTMTGSQLYTSVSNALQTLCPEVTQTTSLTACSTGAVEVGNVPFVEEALGLRSLEQGKFVVTVEQSGYNVTSLRDAMIQSIAVAAQNAATGKNCYDAKYQMTVSKRDSMSWWLPSLFRRDHAHSEQEHKTLCNTVEFVSAQYFGPYARLQPKLFETDWIDAHFAFQANPEGDFLCDLIRDAVDAFAVVAPEFAVEDIELGEAIDVLCKESISERR